MESPGGPSREPFPVGAGTGKALYRTVRPSLSRNLQKRRKTPSSPSRSKPCARFLPLPGIGPQGWRTHRHGRKALPFSSTEAVLQVRTNDLVPHRRPRLNRKASPGEKQTLHSLRMLTRPLFAGTCPSCAERPAPASRPLPKKRPFRQAPADVRFARALTRKRDAP